MSSNLPPVELQQCVYGYDDGHRLLASSKPLSSGDASRLLIASDLAPGLSVAQNVDYWTGIPLAEEQHYALMRTWSAPEISRPGCVWTHVIRIPFGEIARFSDLGILREIARRPNISDSFESYKRRLAALPESLPATVEARNQNLHSAALAVIRAVYGKRDAMPISKCRRIEDAIFLVWSQQWPKLRRQFAFRTAVTRHGSPRELRFDLQVLDDPLIADEDYVSPHTQWELVSVEDLFEPQPTEFRKFLWRYGSDIRDVFGCFRALVEIYAEIRARPLVGSYYRGVLSHVESAFPEASDARLLKSDLVAFVRNSYSRIPEIGTLGIWDALIDSPHIGEWSSAATSENVRLSGEMLNESPEVVAVAQKAIDKPSATSDMFLNQFAHTLTPESFWGMSAGHPQLRQAIARIRPELLDSERLIREPSAQVIKLIKSCDFDPGLAKRVAVRLMKVDNQAFAELMWQDYRAVVVQQLVELPSSWGLGSAWLSLISRYPQEWLKPEILESAVRFNTIGRTIEQLEPDSVAVVKAGVAPWLRALEVSEVGHEDLGLFTFSLVVGLKLSDRKAEVLLHRTFEQVYEGILQQKIPVRVFNMLIRVLPHVQFWREWDNCYRLTLAVAKVTVERKASHEKFASKIGDSYIRWRFLKAVDRMRYGGSALDDDIDLE